VKMTSGPHKNLRRAAVRPAGRRLDIPGLKCKLLNDNKCT